jgi:hypothetical protein
MDSDEVNSISDTVESLQVAGIIRDTFYYLLSYNDFPEHKELFTLDGLGDTTKPSHMKVPSNVSQVEWLRYDVQTATDTDVAYRDITQLSPHTFIDYVSNRDSSESTVTQVLEDTSIKLLIKNDAAPTYWTSFDDEHIVFDSFDSGVEATMQKSKSLAFGILVPQFSMSDTYTPDIDDHLFPLLENEAKSQAFIELKQQSNPKAEQRARKLLTKHQRREARLKNPNYLGPDFGRKGRQRRHVNFDGV